LPRAPGIDTPMPSVPRAEWLGASLLLASSLAFDERIRPIVLANRSRALDRVADGADVIGTAGHIVPALVVTYLAERVLRKESLARATLRIALSYAAADGVEALLKPVTGRVRPYQGREPLTFRPFSASDDFHSFPSAHVVHVASLGAALSAEANRSWVTTLSGLAMMYVGAQRVYRDQHWSSDVVASGMLAVAIASRVDGWLRSGAKASPAPAR
jgi:membrane-associated phospholipid phosphatase